MPNTPASPLVSNRITTGRIINSAIQSLNSIPHPNYDSIYFEKQTTTAHTSMKPPRPTKTLLFLVKKIKKDYKELIKNPNAYTWAWLSEFFEYANKNYYYDFHAKKLGAKQTLSIYSGRHNEAIRQLLNKAAGEQAFDIEELNDGYNIYPKAFAVTYWHRSGPSFTISPNLQQQYQNQDYIRWCPISKIWAETESFQTVHTSASHMAQAIIKGKEHNTELCTACRKRWVQTELKERPEIEADVCPICITVPLRNEQPALNTLISEYHSHKTWKFMIQRLKDEQSLPMGIEIEVHPKDYSRRSDGVYNILQAEKEFNPEWHNIYCERDGSLADGGFEIISNPMTLEFAKDYWGKMIPVIKKYCSGWDVKKYNGDSDKNYGIHITMNRKYWKDYHIARLTLFLDNYENHNFVWPIAQRQYNYNGPAIAGSMEPRLANDYGHTIDRVTKKLKSEHRNVSVHLKEEKPHMEIRMFASTLNFDSFMKNYEFLDAFRAWCYDSAYSIDYKDFLKWLGSKPHHKYRYEHLIAFLDRPKFFCKGTSPITNEFKHLLKGTRGQLDLFPTDTSEDALCV